jgi:hypothetical protein
MVSTTHIYRKIDILKSAQKVELENFIDFLLSKQQAKGKKPKFGCAKGRFKMSDDFDEPLEDLMEYMY